MLLALSFKFESRRQPFSQSIQALRLQSIFIIRSSERRIMISSFLPRQTPGISEVQSLAWFSRLKLH